MAGKKLITWVLVADDRKARIFRNLGPNTGLKPIFEREAGQKKKLTKTQKISTSSGLFGLFSSEKTIKKTVIEKVPEDKDFIEWIAQKLNANGAKDKFDVLVIISPKGIIDEFTDALTDKVIGKLHSQLSKDLTRADEFELKQYLDVFINL